MTLGQRPFFSHSSTSVMPVTQDHFYNINATEGHKISFYIMMLDHTISQLNRAISEAYHHLTDAIFHFEGKNIL